MSEAEGNAAVGIDDPGFLRALIGDGRPLLSVAGLALILSGLFALFLGCTGQFLPHDEKFLGMTARQLCSVHGCRIVHFMIHDRVSFGGALIAVGLLYLWLAEFPLRAGQEWAWWLFALSGTIGFGSFFAYLGYGYLDTWHGVATLGLFPVFVVGLVVSWKTLPEPIGIRSLIQPSWGRRPGFGRLCLMATALGMIGGGLTIMTVGMTHVFVPQDLGFLKVSVDEMRALNPRLVPLIAHDRAGFGGAVCCCGAALFFCVWCATPSRSLWQMLLLAGVAGFSTAIGVHPAIGYDDPVHLAPAIAGAVLYMTGMASFYRPCFARSPVHSWSEAVASPIPSRTT